jgi:hypothetical protein
MTDTEVEGKLVIEVKRGQVFAPLQLSLQLLLHLNEDFDDDLLQDAIELLDNED